jgi:DNA-directed RNA polymerase specialized sigma24 family protein
MKKGALNNPVLDSLPAFSRKQIDYLVVRLQQGDNVRDELLFQLLAYIKIRLGMIIFRETRLESELDNLVSYLTVWLMRIIENVRTGANTGENVLGYVSMSLKNRCKDFLSTLRSFGPANFSRDEKMVRHCLSTVELYEKESLADCIDKLFSLADTEEEYIFLQMRFEGYKSNEIAHAMGTNKKELSLIRQRLYLRYKETD